MRWGALAEAVRELEPPSDPDDLAAVLRVRDQFEAKLALGIAAFDREALWQLDNQTSAVAVPALAEAWLSGRLSGGQVKAIVANVSDKAAELFAEHAPDLIPVLEPMGVQETARAMQLWRERADALLDKGEPPEPERSLHASETFQGRTELKGSFDAASGEVIRTARRADRAGDRRRRLPPPAPPDHRRLHVVPTPVARPSSPGSTPDRSLGGGYSSARYVPSCAISFLGASRQ